MEFAASSSLTSAEEKNKKKKNKKNKKKNKMCKDGQKEVGIEEEFDAFLYLLNMKDEDEGKEEVTSVAWNAGSDKEKIMSQCYVGTFNEDTSSLETEFYRHFMTHLASKKFLAGPETKRLKDRIFLLMAKEKEAEGEEDSEARKIMFGHFLYDELRLQHQYLTTPQDTDTPNDIAHKLTLASTVCGIIRNCNSSRDSICKDIDDNDDNECSALLNVPFSPPASCLKSVLRPLYNELLNRQGKEEAAVSANACSCLSSDLRALCCRNIIDHNPTPKSLRFFEGPPEWHSNLEFFMKRIQYSQPTPAMLGFVKHALREAQEFRVTREQQKFYDLAYGRNHIHRYFPEFNIDDVGHYSKLELPFCVHVMLHRAFHAVIKLKGSTALPDDAERISLLEFKKLVKIKLSPLFVTPCSKCALPCVGECVCGTSYCSAACLETDDCSVCSQGCPTSLMYLTPISWGASPLNIP